jgi:hypothetical protein
MEARGAVSVLPHFGAPALAAGFAPLDFASVQTPGSSSVPAEFAEAVEAMGGARVRREIQLGPIRPPHKLAPYSYALGAEVADASGDGAFGRLILLYDPEGDEQWHGSLRLVAYIQAEIEAALADDPLLPEVAWSWRSEELAAQPEPRAALGGTVTAEKSVRYGDIAGPNSANQLELRASWSPLTGRLAPHVEAFCRVLADAAGLPPSSGGGLHAVAP